MADPTLDRPSDPLLEQLRNSPDPRVRGLLQVASNAAHRVVMLNRKRDVTPDLRKRAEIDEAVAFQSALQQSAMAGAIALDNVRLSSALRVVLAYIASHGGRDFEAGLSLIIGKHVQELDGGPLVECPRLAAHPGCILCDDTAQVPVRVVELWKSLAVILDTVLARPMPEPVISLRDAARWVRSLEQDSTLDGNVAFEAGVMAVIGRVAGRFEKLADEVGDKTPLGSFVVVRPSAEEVADEVAAERGEVSRG